jgi:effector-binding domain-containing protein
MRGSIGLIRGWFLDFRIVEIIEPARVEQRPERMYVGIRVVTPFRGMLKVRDELLREVHTWIEESGTETIGYGFLRLHVIDMNGPMDLEAGYFTRGPCEGEGRIQPGRTPAGRYATLTYRDHALRANRALIEWARDNGVEFDRHDEPPGDAFACRYEAFLTDPRLEPRKTKWAVELAFRIAD